MTNSEFTDAELQARLSKGDREAFDLLYHRYWHFLYQSAYKIFQQHDVTEDVVQEVFLDLWAKRFSNKIDNLKAFLYQSTKYQVFKIIRHNKVIAAHVERDFILHVSNNDALDSLAIQDIRRILDRTVSNLPEKCRHIFELSRNGHMNTKEIAEQLSISPKTVENQLNIALKKIRTALGTFFLIAEVIFDYYSKR